MGRPRGPVDFPFLVTDVLLPVFSVHQGPLPAAVTVVCRLVVCSARHFFHSYALERDCEGASLLS